MTRTILRKKRPLPAREMAEMFGVNPRTIRSWNAVKREDWIDEQAAMRESIRAYHDDEGHTWPQTAEHFGMSSSAVRQRCYRAREGARGRGGGEIEASARRDATVRLTLNVAPNANTALREATMEIRHADLQIEVEDAEDGGVLLTIIDSARLSLSLPRRTARQLLDAIDACMKTGERQTTDSVDVWRTADDLPLFGMHVGIDGASWTCGAVRSRDVDGLADELEALLE